MDMANAALRQRGGKGVEIVRVQRRIAAALQIEIPPQSVTALLAGGQQPGFKPVIRPQHAERRQRREHLHVGSRRQTLLRVRLIQHGAALGVAHHHAVRRSNQRLVLAEGRQRLAKRLLMTLAG
ncbi:Uncharacterised protein [Serratia marcescens]|nr:Uncharacterised protein [Serratia marcescens]